MTVYPLTPAGRHHWLDDIAPRPNEFWRYIGSPYVHGPVPWSQVVTSLPILPILLAVVYRGRPFVLAESVYPFFRRLALDFTSPAYVLCPRSPRKA